uniref:C1q domain-containing protein n=1 Tax=Gadus morhua TaxID=8049 RepID=A0A8C5AQM8_GADMO
DQGAPQAQTEVQKRTMERTFLLLAAFIFSSGQCQDTDPSRDPDASLAVCKPDICSLFRDLGVYSAQTLELQSATNAAVLQLEVGDNVYTKLYAYRELYDDVMFYNTFSGFLPNGGPEENHGAHVPPLGGLHLLQRPILELQRLIQEQAQQLMALKESTLAAVPRMAFTAALGHSLGPVHIDLTVKYPLIISNIGNGYNPATGIFTARVSGMYYFRYTMFNNLGSRSNSVMSLMKNSQRMVSTWDTSGSDDNDTATNAAVLQLEEGDNVYTRLYANRQIYDDGANYNTFSGFLLFPL